MHEDDPHDYGKMSDARLRHEAFSPFNIINGYIELLMESSYTASDHFVGAQIHELDGEVKELLRAVHELSGVSRTRSERPLQEQLERSLLSPLAQLSTCVDGLVQLFRQHDRDEVAEDMKRILAAVQRLDRIVAELVVRIFSQSAQPH